MTRQEHTLYLLPFELRESRASSLDECESESAGLWSQATGLAREPFGLEANATYLYERQWKHVLVKARVGIWMGDVGDAGDVGIVGMWGRGGRQEAEETE